MALHEVQLKGYSVRPGNLSLGTFDSYGIEQLHVTADDSWDGLDILAVFHAPNGDAKKVVVGADGMLNVPPEATAKQAGNGRIVFVGLAENVQRITVDMGYNIKTHSDIEGDNPGVPTPDVVQQILQAALNAEQNSAKAKSVADDLRNDAANGKFNGKDGAKGDKGETGTTPQLKIGEDNLWNVSYDNGATWVSLGVKATGDAGKDGVTPHIGENGNWWVGDTDTGVSAKGQKGDPGPQGPAGEIPEDYPQIQEDVSKLKQDLGDITQIDKSSNILEIRNYTEGRYYSASSGDYRNNGNFFTVDNYIEVEPSCNYVLSEFIDGVFRKLLNSIIIFYDKNNKYLSGGQYSTFTTAENVKYIRISAEKDALTKQLSLEKGTEPSKIWVPYYKALHVKGEKVINFSYSDIKDKPTINGVEISGNKSSKDYKIPDVSEITETYNLYKTNEIIVDVNGSGDFEKLQDAIESIVGNSKNNRFIIYIKEGEYDLAEGITDGENDGSVIGLTIPNWVTLKGLGNRENIILKAKFINKSHYVSTLNFKETGAIENLTIIGENTRYVIHDDFARKSNGYKRSVKHCIIKGVTTYYSTVYGAGTGDGADLYFEDVIFDGSQVGANSRPANTFTVHNVLASQKNRNIVFKNCIFVSTNEKNVKFKTLAYRTSTGADNANDMITNVSLYGCKFDGTSKGFELVEENPDVYGKGCYYFVNGYGNINAGYEINTTDNKDYSNRVNLV